MAEFDIRGTMKQRRWVSATRATFFARVISVSGFCRKPNFFFFGVRENAKYEKETKKVTQVSSISHMPNALLPENVDLDMEEGGDGFLHLITAKILQREC